MSFNIKLFLTFVLFGVFLALFSVYSFSKVAHERQMINKLQQSNEMVLKKEKNISTYIQNLDNHLLAIVNNKIFQKYSENGSFHNHISGLFETITLSGHDILQIKYTNKDGKDLIVKKSAHGKEMESFIDNKIDKHSFDQIMKNKIDDIWHSAIGLNINETIDKPIYIIGIHLKNGVLRFYVSVDEILDILHNNYYKLFLVDKDGKIIIDSQNKLSWSKYLHNDIELKTILSENDYSFLKFTSKKTDNYISINLQAYNEDDATLILMYPDFNTMIDDEMHYVYISILISTIVLAVILAFIFSQPMSKMTKRIERLNNKLDKKVEQRTAQLKDSLRIIDKYIIRSVTDTDGMILKVSDAFCKVSQYSKEELIGQNHSLIRHPDMPNSLFENMWKTIKSGKKWDGKVKNRAKDGSAYWVESHVEPNFVNDKIVSYTAVRIKISNKVKLEELNKSLEKRIEEEVQKSTEQLELIQKEQLRSVKLSSIGALAAGITHEINTPLTYIKGNFELMKYDIEDLPKNELRDRIISDADTIMDGLNRISNIVESMKEVAQTSSETIENVNIYATLMTALTLSFNNSKQVSRIYLNDELFDISHNKEKLMFNALGQKQRIEQLWIIIISNALDELVKIDDYENRRLDIKIGKINNKIVVDFLDNAGGIKEEIIDKIFEPFVSNKERGGIGIGLNVAKKIVDEHGGKITATNIKNGAHFKIELYIEGASC